MTLRYVDFKVYDPVYVAIDKGFFASRNLEVTLIGSGTLAGPTGIQAISAGSADAGLSSLPAIINANAAGLPILGTTDIQSALPEQPLETYFVRADSPIKSVKDLTGTKFAVNLIKSSFHYTALMALDQNGIDEKAVNFVLLPFDQQAAALANKQVDVIGLMEPYASQAKAVYGDQFRELFNAIDIFGTKQFTTHFVNRVWAKDHTAEVRAFVDGIVEAIAWIEANEDAAKPIIAKYTGVDAKYIPAYHFQKNGAVIQADVQYWLDLMLKRGDITAKWLQADQIASNLYNSAVK